MNTLQLSEDLSVRQIAAAVRKLSEKDKDKLLELIWDYIYEVPKDIHERYVEHLKKVEADPSRLIPLDEAMRRLRSKT